MSRRGHGEGSFRKRADGRWEARITLPDGRRRSAYGATKKEAQAHARDLRAAAELGAVAPGRSQTLEQYLVRWLNDSAQPALRHSTWRSYESLVRVRVVPHIGRVRLDRLTAQHLQSLYAQLLAEELAPRSVVFTHRVLHRALKQAFRWGLIASNPAEKVSPPRPQRHEMATLNAAQVSALLQSVKDPQRRVLYQLAVSTGMRQGELLGLRWDDVDLQHGSVAVRHTLVRRKGDGLVLGDVKSARSHRLVALGQRIVIDLRAWRTEQKSVRFAAGPAWHELGFVFTRPDGRPFEGSHVTRLYQRALEDAGLPKTRFHDLRHTAATLLLQEGVHPKVVQEMLGHATIAVTLDTYSHVAPHMQEAAAGVFDRLITTA